MNLTASNPQCDCPVCAVIRSIEARLTMMCEDPEVRAGAEALGASLEEEHGMRLGQINRGKILSDMVILSAVFAGMSNGMTVDDVARVVGEALTRAEEASGHTQTHHQQGRA